MLAEGRKPRYHYEIGVRRGLVADLARPLEAVRIADLGCGDGTLSLQFLTESTSIVLVDSSAAALSHAESAVPSPLRDRVTLVRADFPPLEDEETYDLVMCVGLLAHLPDVDAALGAVARLVAQEGAALVQITDASTPAGFLLHALGRIREGRRGYRFPVTTERAVVARMSGLGLQLDDSRCYFPTYSSLTAKIFSIFNAPLPTTAPRYIGGDKMLLFRRHQGDR